MSNVWLQTGYHEPLALKAMWKKTILLKMSIDLVLKLIASKVFWQKLIKKICIYSWMLINCEFIAVFYCDSLCIQNYVGGEIFYKKMLIDLVLKLITSKVFGKNRTNHAFTAERQLICEFIATFISDSLYSSSTRVFYFYWL